MKASTMEVEASTFIGPNKFDEIVGHISYMKFDWKGG